MIQTGLKQAVIAYRVNSLTGAPIDVNGQLTSVSGRRQAIALLTGTANPNPTLYEVQFYFAASEVIQGKATAQFTADCPRVTFGVTPVAVTLSAEHPTAVLNIVSSGAWALVGSVPNIATLSQTSGTGNAAVTVTRTATMGNGSIVFKIGAAAISITVQILNLESEGWILETGAYRMFKLWKNAGLWKLNP